MTLLATVFAAVVCTVIWYTHAPKSKMCVSVLCWIYWGASIMWLADCIFEFAEEGSAVFTPDITTLLDDLFLGLSVIALGLIVWVIVLLVKDPLGVFRKASSSAKAEAPAPALEEEPRTEKEDADKEEDTEKEGKEQKERSAGILSAQTGAKTMPCASPGKPADSMADTGAEEGQA